MSFTINQTGFERGATQLLLDTAPIIIQRHAEDAQDAAYAIAIGGEPITTQYTRTQTHSFLRLRLRLIAGSDIATLITLLEGAGPVDVKLTPGDATITQCMFGPREDQNWVPYNDEYATGKTDGTAVDPIFLQYKVELLLLRL
jgi:hypothetical protein